MVSVVHVPPWHDPLAHSSLCRQSLPPGLVPGTHVPLLQRKLRHSPSPEHCSSFFMGDAEAQTPEWQMLSAQSVLAVQGSLTGLFRVASLSPQAVRTRERTTVRARFERIMCVSFRVFNGHQPPMRQGCQEEARDVLVEPWPPWHLGGSTEGRANAGQRGRRATGLFGVERSTIVWVQCREQR